MARGSCGSSGNNQIRQNHKCSDLTTDWINASWNSERGITCASFCEQDLFGNNYRCEWDFKKLNCVKGNYLCNDPIMAQPAPSPTSYTTTKALHN